MRVSDVLRLRWSELTDHRLSYTMGKNGKNVSIKVPDKAFAILKQYEGSEISDLVFPDLKMIPDKSFNNRSLVQLKIKAAVKKLNSSLKEIAEIAGIEKTLTMHIARHTFGNISGDRIPIQMLQKLYRHSSITTTIGYQANFINKYADDALDAVIGS